MASIAALAWQPNAKQSTGHGHKTSAVMILATEVTAAPQLHSVRHYGSAAAHCITAHRCRSSPVAGTAPTTVTDCVAGTCTCSSGNSDTCMWASRHKRRFQSVAPKSYEPLRPSKAPELRCGVNSCWKCSHMPSPVHGADKSAALKKAWMAVKSDQDPD